MTTGHYRLGPSSGTVDRMQQTTTRKLLRRIVVTGALAVTVSGLSASAASAGVPQQIRTHGGHAVFDDLGELLVVKDTRADGLSVMANLNWGSGTATVTDSGPGGSGTTRNLSIPEGRTVYLLMCYEVGGVTVKCSKVQRGVA